MSVTGAAARKIETFAHLDVNLKNVPYRICHGVHWSNVEHGFSAYGETDFIVVAPNGRVLLIGQKSGFLAETSDGLVKSYQGRAKNVDIQIPYIGTVGSGKTQLALAEYYAVIDAGLRPPHVCFNRPLADHIERLAPAGALPPSTCWATRCCAPAPTICAASRFFAIACCWPNRCAASRGSRRRPSFLPKSTSPRSTNGYFASCSSA